MSQLFWKFTLELLSNEAGHLSYLAQESNFSHADEPLKQDALSDIKGAFIYALRICDIPENQKETVIKALLSLALASASRKPNEDQLLLSECAKTISALDPTLDYVREAFLATAPGPDENPHWIFSNYLGDCSMPERVVRKVIPMTPTNLDKIVRVRFERCAVGWNISLGMESENLDLDGSGKGRLYLTEIPNETEEQFVKRILHMVKGMTGRVFEKSQDDEQGLVYTRWKSSSI